MSSFFLNSLSSIRVQSFQKSNLLQYFAAACSKIKTCSLGSSLLILGQSSLVHPSFQTHSSFVHLVPLLISLKFVVSLPLFPFLQFFLSSAVIKSYFHSAFLTIFLFTAIFLRVYFLLPVSYFQFSFSCLFYRTLPRTFHYSICKIWAVTLLIWCWNFSYFWLNC